MSTWELPQCSNCGEFVDGYDDIETDEEDGFPLEGLLCERCAEMFDREGRVAANRHPKEARQQALQIVAIYLQQSVEVLGSILGEFLEQEDNKDMPTKDEILNEIVWIAMSLKAKAKGQT